MAHQNGGRKGRAGGRDGEGSWRKRRKSGGGGGEDFRWRKKKKGRQAEAEGGVPLAVVARPPSGDAIEGDVGVAAADSGEGAGSRTVSAAGAGAVPQNETEKARKVIPAKRKEKLAQVKEQRRKRFEEEREAADARMKETPAAFLWDKFVSWAGPGRLSPLERRSEAWGAENVEYLHVDGPAEGGEKVAAPTIINAVKKSHPGLYARAKEPRDGVPGVCVFLVAASGLRAAHLGRSMYDGKPVGKLFGKHISREEQREWLEKNARKKSAPTAVGTARRLHVLCDEASLSLACTTIFIIDMNRDKKLQTVLDMAATRDELFDFIHVHLRPLVKAGNLKIILHSSQ